MPREGQMIDRFLLFAFLLLMKNQLLRRTMPSSSSLLRCSELFLREKRFFQVQPHISTALQLRRSGHRALHAATKAQLLLPSIFTSTTTLQVKADIKKPPQHLSFAPNICSGVSGDFEISCLFICFQSWDAVWSFLSPEMQNAALSSTVCANGSDWCLLEEHPRGRELNVCLGIG